MLSQKGDPGVEFILPDSQATIINMVLKLIEDNSPGIGVKPLSKLQDPSCSSHHNLSLPLCQSFSLALYLQRTEKRKNGLLDLNLPSSE